ncbi:copper resistance protein B [Noviluteimonas gilva]|uniref:Copper resistance protein B n=1 Tax=Noviluteimonas gilva TaxID=2682097 RepID=A0A7C9LKD7_9GAMM|nr:copper resistance protein B [Lysobacter gilvus]MUV15419.1 copper resistance protein B [Lysobacter gilvus]
MKTRSITTLAVGLLLSTGAAAQHHDHSSMPMTMPMPQPAQSPKAAPQPKAAPKPAGKPKPKPKPVSKPAAEKPVDHSTMDHSQMQMDRSTMYHSQMQMDHSMSAPGALRTPIPELTDADREAARPPAHDHPVHDNTVHSKVMFNRLEAFDADHGNGLAWEGQAWVGTDTDKLWLRSEGERVDDRTEAADLEVMYGRPIARWWDVVGGVRHDFKPGASQDWAAIGVVGIAPYKFEVEATAYLGASGRTAARIEAEYELLLTNRLILQPLVEANFNGKDDERRGVGSGLSTMEAGLRLRYEVHRKFAPYIGVVHERAFGDTADFRRALGEDKSDTRIVAGVRVWF